MPAEIELFPIKRHVGVEKLEMTKAPKVLRRTQRTSTLLQERPHHRLDTSTAASNHGRSGSDPRALACVCLLLERQRHQI
jgi:hypothetical protein